MKRMLAVATSGILPLAGCGMQGLEPSSAPQASVVSEYSPSDAPVGEGGGWSEEYGLPPGILSTDHYGPPMESLEKWHRAMTDHYSATTDCLADKGGPEQTVNDPYTPQASMCHYGWDVDPQRFTADLRQCFRDVGEYPMPPEATEEHAEQSIRRPLSPWSV